MCIYIYVIAQQRRKFWKGYIESRGERGTRGLILAFLTEHTGTSVYLPPHPVHCPGFFQLASLICVLSFQSMEAGLCPAGAALSIGHFMNPTTPYGPTASWLRRDPASAKAGGWNGDGETPGNIYCFPLLTFCSKIFPLSASRSHLPVGLVWGKVTVAEGPGRRNSKRKRVISGL